MIKFACLSPHPPLLLPDIGSPEDRKKVKKTIESLEFLGKKLKEAKPDKIIISSPHPDWGFNVPLYFLAKDFKREIKTFLTDLESPASWFQKGKEVYKNLDKDNKLALIASGDMSHCLKADGPYGFQPDGPKFDKELIRALEEKDTGKILELEELYPKASECGLRSFSFILGILEQAKINWKAKILSYEAPFGVGYLVANFKI